MSNSIQMQTLMNKVRKEKAAQKGGSLDLIRPGDGRNTYRILPSWRTEGTEEEKLQFWHDYGLHWIKKSKGDKPDAVLLCDQKTFGKPCEICAAISGAIQQSTDDTVTEVLKKECTSKQKYLLNVLHLNASDKAMRIVPQVLEVGPKIFEDGIIPLISEYGDITALEGGTDIVINRSGSGLNTEYSVMPAKDSLAKVANKIMDKVTNLDDAVQMNDPTKLQTGMATIAGLVGIELAPSDKVGIAHDSGDAVDAEYEALAADVETSAETPAVETSSSLDDATDAEVVEETEAEESESSLDDDELDALMAELDKD